MWVSRAVGSCESGTESTQWHQQTCAVGWRLWTYSWAGVQPSRVWGPRPRCTDSTSRTPRQFTFSTLVYGCAPPKDLWFISAEAHRCSGFPAGSRPHQHGQRWKSPVGWPVRGHLRPSTQPWVRHGASAPTWKMPYVNNVGGVGLWRFGRCCPTPTRAQNRRWKVKHASSCWIMAFRARNCSTSSRGVAENGGASTSRGRTRESRLNTRVSIGTPVEARCFVTRQGSVAFRMPGLDFSSYRC